MNRSAKIGLIVGGVVLALLVLVPLVWGAVTRTWFGGTGGWWGGSWGMMGPGIMGGFGMMGIGMVVFWGLVIWGIVVLVRRNGAVACCDEHAHAGGSAALDTLKQRYAKGEIGREEYETKKKDLA